jgi:RNA polymerase sigma-70 factor (ECF subfamily)
MTRVPPEPADVTVELILGEAPNLRGIARRLTRSEPDTEDLVQETLLRAFDARGRFRPGTSVRAWTTTIMRRLFLTGAIRAKRRGLRTETDAGLTLDASAARDVARSDDRAHDVESLDDALDDRVKLALGRVPEVYRTAFLLSAVCEMTYEEIGHQLRVPVGTVMSRLHRARRRLQDDLARQG